MGLHTSPPEVDRGTEVSTAMQSLATGFRRATLCRFHDGKGTLAHEADVSAESPPPRQDARIPGAHEDQGRAQGVEAAQGKGSQTAHGLEARSSSPPPHAFPRHERLTSSAEFQALFQGGKRIDRRSLIVLWRDTGESRRAGFAVSRQVRGAVRRNRARRRMREAYRKIRETAPAGAALVVIARPAVLTASFASLVAELREALLAIPGRRSPA
jgi:ribonuclease P protein component